ncbi:MAG: Bifunctional NAD(P)H-hydrate repair enzyme Nnr [Chlamydiae bacterium]|nr:Bifunctional NAD(P)H-hydrate repair enzyme Nnr [Chlamydiota bacterium]
MDGLPVVTPQVMKEIEKRAFEAGESEETYMKNAGRGIASAVEGFLVTLRTSGEVSLLIGKGNNGGDAFVAGELLKKKGFSVTAYCLFPLEECSSLSQKMAKGFVKAGGKVEVISSAPSFDGEKGVIVDGIVGTGFQGAARGLVAEVIDAANTSHLPIFAIDIPSGLQAESGVVENIAIKAHTTLFLGLPKIGFFIGKGWDHVGKLDYVDFGLPAKFFEEVDPVAHLISEKRTASYLPTVERSRHKYQAGYVLAVAGSSGMSGAAIMSAFSVLKVGAGIVRLFFPHEMKEELAAAPFELIKEGWDLKDPSRILEEAKRAKVLILGPGMGRSSKAMEAIGTLLNEISLPTVLDADALFFLAEHPDHPLPERTILTPHHGEMARILGKEVTLSSCNEYVKEKKVTLVLKGAPTILFHRHAEPLIIPHGDPGMATAGTGDVLTGLIAGLLAQGLDPRKAAGLGVLLHSLSGEIAAKEESSYSLTATDLIHFLPEAIQILLHYQGA